MLYCQMAKPERGYAAIRSVELRVLQQGHQVFMQFV